MLHTDTIIDARWVIPVDSSNQVLDHHSVVIQGNKILDILPTSNVEKSYTGRSRLCRRNHALIPGFINAHTHAAMSLLRGAAEDLPLFDWLNQVIWPLEGQFVDEKFVLDGTVLAIAEMIKSGTTCMNDMYLFPEIVGSAAEKLNFRAVLGMIVLDFPTAWAKSADEYLDKGRKLHEAFKESALVGTMLAPHAPYTVSDDTLVRVKELSEDLNLGIHMHVHETQNEVDDAVRDTGIRPIERLHNFGFIDSKFLAVHATALTNDEITLFADQGTSIAHCPKSNLKLASGVCPTAKLLQYKVNVAVGTDGAASNNSLNMIEEMRFAALLGKVYSNEASNLNVNQALRMATINGAKCLGIDSMTGSLEIGKLADISAIDLSSLECSPLYDPVAHIVHSASRDQVTDVFINGRQVLENKKVLTIDERECIETANNWEKLISSSL